MSYYSVSHMFLTRMSTKVGVETPVSKEVGRVLKTPLSRSLKKQLVVKLKEIFVRM